MLQLIKPSTQWQNQSKIIAKQSNNGKSFQHTGPLLIKLQGSNPTGCITGSSPPQVALFLMRVYGILLPQDVSSLLQVYAVSAAYLYMFSRQMKTHKQIISSQEMQWLHWYSAYIRRSLHLFWQQIAPNQGPKLIHPIFTIACFHRFQL